MLTAVLGCEVVPHDDNSRDSMYDLLIEYPDDRPAAAAEVVSTRDSAAMSQSATIANRRYTRRPELARMWFVLLQPAVQVRQTIVGVPGLLAELERVGLTKVGPSWQPVWWDRLRALGLWACFSAEPTVEHPPGFWLMSQVKGEWEAPGDEMVRACDAFLADTPDVPAKLAASGTSERHAVVMVTSDWLGTLAALESGVVPKLAPTLPAGIDRLWLVPLEKVPPIRILYWPGDGAWHAFTVTSDMLSNTVQCSA